MNYVCPICKSQDWEFVDKDVYCTSCENTSKVESMEKTEEFKKRNLNEIMPVDDQLKFQLND